ncbi:MAG: S-layer homology domain-containing protein [Eubacteriales bacterium]
MSRKWISIIIIFAMTSTTLVTQLSYKYSTNYVYGEEVQETYKGKLNADEIINNIDFSDVSSEHWAKESVTRLGSLDIIKGYNENNLRRYRPDENVSNERALAFILRIIGLEEEAQQAGEVLEQQYETNENTLSIWSKGYMQVASNMGLITQNDFLDALDENQEGLIEGENFLRQAVATREQVAEWLVKALNQFDPEIIEPQHSQNSIFNYNDWESVSADKVPFVEAVIDNNIMIGSNNSFRPNDPLTGAEMAQVIKNVDDILYEVMDISRHIGVVEKIEEENTMNNEKRKIRNYYIRDSNGDLSLVQHEYIIKENENVEEIDVPVLKEGEIQGLLGLETGEQIEYLTNDTTDEMLYIYSEGKAEENKIKGKLQPIYNTDEITIKNPEGLKYTYNLSKRLISENGIKIEENIVPIDKLSIGQEIVLNIEGDLVVGLEYYHENPLDEEISGIVKEVDSDFGYITITEWFSGEDITKYFYPEDIIVEKQMHYDDMDEVGYIDEVFDKDIYDDRDMTIDAIEPGDIIHIRLNRDDSDYITQISAKTNYIVKFGVVRDFNYNHENDYNFIVENDDGRLQYFEVKEPLIIQKGEKKIAAYELEDGDWVKMLVNQAVIDSGHIEESVKEITVNPYKNKITKVQKGQLWSYNKLQNTVTLLNSYELSKTGWTNLRKSTSFKIDDKELEVFYNGRQISLNEAIHRVGQTSANAYVALDNFNKISKINIEDSNDRVLDYDYVLNSDGGRSFRLFNTINPINITPGTIVLRNGRLVEPSSILSPDYTQVVMNRTEATVVNIINEPGNSALTISRGRINEIDDYNSFEVNSQGMLNDMNWSYSPIERTYTIDHETIIKDEDGIIPLENFKDYEEYSQVDEVFTIISEGTKAKYLIKNPYSTEGFTGTIYEIEEDNFKIKDVEVYDVENKSWDVLSNESNYSSVIIEENSIVLKNNQASTLGELENGDRVRVLTTENLLENYNDNNLREAIGYIVLVE